MRNQKIILTVVILILLAGNFFFGAQYFVAQKEIQQTQIALKTQNINAKILDFTTLFIEKVLKAETEIDFETRLKLENAVRNLDDEEILAQWSRLVDSKTEAGAQEEVKNLLEILVSKIKAQ